MYFCNHISPVASLRDFTNFYFEKKSLLKAVESNFIQNNFSDFLIFLLTLNNYLMK